MDAKLSVVIPTYCDASYLRQCLESLTPHSRLIREVCISDNASTDQTPDLLNAYHPSGFTLRKVVQETHVPLHVNWERALALSTGKYVLFLSSDDYLLPNGLREAIGILEADPSLSGVALRMQYFVDGTDEVLIDLPPPEAEQALNGPVSGAVAWMVSHANHDELVYSVWRRSVIVSALLATNPTSREVYGWWWVLNAILASPGPNRLGFSRELSLMKRVQKSSGGPPSPGSKGRLGMVRRSIVRATVSLRGRYGSLDNVLRMRREGLIDWPSFRRLLLQRRINASTGTTFGGPMSPRLSFLDGRPWRQDQMLN